MTAETDADELLDRAFQRSPTPCAAASSPA